MATSKYNRMTAHSIYCDGRDILHFLPISLAASSRLLRSRPWMTKRGQFHKLSEMRIRWQALSSRPRNLHPFTTYGVVAPRRHILGTTTTVTPASRNAATPAFGARSSVMTSWTLDGSHILQNAAIWNLDASAKRTTRRAAVIIAAFIAAASSEVSDGTPSEIA